MRAESLLAEFHGGLVPGVVFIGEMAELQRSFLRQGRAGKKQRGAARDDRVSDDGFQHLGSSRFADVLATIVAVFRRRCSDPRQPGLAVAGFVREKFASIAFTKLDRLLGVSLGD
ncbi:hypothetical protein [Jiella pelagia]|uniref:Uncharacterized protein n=1 Tax=Jiella pelagia TaxID=2986949 RepID=A0ABY7BXS2_9HYPH|nr:hypothetical protein [Jiella pelagia]WAP68213.1 hypothetical protein OH818_23055 [Jiella pelagia]